MAIARLETLEQLEQANPRMFPQLHRARELLRRADEDSRAAKVEIDVLKDRLAVADHRISVLCAEAEKMRGALRDQSKLIDSYEQDLKKPGIAPRNYSICPACNGDGGAASQCYKCQGSGWV